MFSRIWYHVWLVYRHDMFSRIWYHVSLVYRHDMFSRIWYHVSLVYRHDMFSRIWYHVSLVYRHDMFSRIWYQTVYFDKELLEYFIYKVIFFLRHKQHVTMYFDFFLVYLRNDEQWNTLINIIESINNLSLSSNLSLTILSQAQ